MRVCNLLPVLPVLFFVSCRTVKQTVIRKDIPVITENRLLKNVRNNDPDYVTVFSKRMDVSLTDEKGNHNFRASLKIRRDSFIQVSVTAPLGFEFARILMTNDSIRFVDFYHKKYFLSDYHYFYDKYDLHIDYNSIQNILTNTFLHFGFYEGTAKNGKYKLDRTEDGYELSTIEERALSRKIKKLYKKRRKNKDFTLVLQKILIDPEIYRPLSVSVEDVEENTGISVNYSAFKDFSNRKFPERIVFDLFSGAERISLALKFQKIEFDVPVDIKLKIPSKYKRMEYL